MPRVAPILPLSALLLFYGANAAADTHRPPIEWSTWVRLGARAVTHSEPAGVATPRVILPPPDNQTAADLEAGLGADLSFGSDVRVGAWAETRTSSAAVGGGELLIGATPAKLDMFWYQGEGLLVLRAGGNADVLTGAIAYGYRAPWSLWGPWTGTTRYMIGVRLVVSATRSRAHPEDWTATVGLEFEPVGAFRYLFGVRSWY